MRLAQASLRQRHRDQTVGGDVCVSEQLTVEQQISQRQAAAESQGDLVDLADESEPATKRVKREASPAAAAVEPSPDEPSVHVSQEEPHDGGARVTVASSAVDGIAPLTPRAPSAATAAPPTLTPVERIALCEEQLGLSAGGRPVIHRLKAIEEQVGVTGSGALPPRIAVVEAALGLGSAATDAAPRTPPARPQTPAHANNCPVNFDGSPVCDPFRPAGPPADGLDAAVAGVYAPAHRTDNPPSTPPPPSANIGRSRRPPPTSTAAGHRQPPPAPAAAAAAAAPASPPAAAAAGRTWLSVSYAQKDEAKALGARFDGDEKRWYVPQGRDPTPLLARWPPRAPTYLQVPFAQKDDAKAMGARWDAQRKVWYAPASRDPAPFLRRWPRWSGPVGAPSAAYGFGRP